MQLRSLGMNSAVTGSHVALVGASFAGASTTGRRLVRQAGRSAAVVLVGLTVAAAVIVSTYYAQNVKLLVGLVGGVVFVLMTLRWPELSILSLVALFSGLVSTTWLPLLHLGPVSLNVSDVMLLLLLSLVFLRATAFRGVALRDLASRPKASRAAALLRVGPRRTAQAATPAFVLYNSPLLLPLLLFLGAVVLAAIYGISLQHVGFNTALRTVRMLAEYILFIPTLQLVRDEQSLRRLLTGLVIFAVVLLIGVLFPNKFDPLLPVMEREAATGGTSYGGMTRVYFAGDLILYALIPVSVAALGMIRKGRQFWRIGLLAFLLFWLFRTFFRNYWLTLGVVCTLLLVFLTPPERVRLLKRMAPALLGAALLVVALSFAQPSSVERVSYVISDRVGSLLNDPTKTEGSLRWRVIETYYALPKIESHLLLGVGLGNSYRPPMEDEGGTMYDDWANRYIENGYLYVLLMTGLVGFVPFLWLYGAFLWRTFTHVRQIRDDWLRAVCVGFGLATLGMLVGNIVNPLLVFGPRLVFFPLALGVNEIIIRLQVPTEA